MRPRRLLGLGCSVGLVGLTLAAGCGDNAVPDPINASGGNTSTGGVGAGSGGAANTGGNSRTSGGSAPAPTGGTSPATGGNSTSGGSVGQSGGVGPSGTSAGGATATGGTSETGGSTSTGGATSNGGATHTGGTANLGGAAGASSKGGGTGSGGSKATGGAANTGGSATGGGNTGGSAGTTAITVWLAGDSTVQQCSGTCPCGWGSQFKPYFSNLVTVTNSAVGGRSVRSWLYTTQPTADSAGECLVDKDSSGNPILQARWTAMLSGMKAGDYLLIQFGINDGAAACNTSGAEGRHVGLAAFKTTYGMMAQAAKDRGANPLFLTPVSAISCSGSSAQASRGAYVTATKEAGATYSVPVIDLHQLSINLYNSLGFCPVPGGDVSASTTGNVGDFFCNDHTHFEAAGANQIASLISKALRDQNIGLAAYLK